MYENHPFKRGSMKFDDYNYLMYNPYILVEDDTINMTQAQKSAKKKKYAIEKTESEGLSFEAMDKALVGDYEFTELNLKTPIEIDIEQEEKVNSQQKVQPVSNLVDDKVIKDENGLIVEDKEDLEAEQENKGQEGELEDDDENLMVYFDKQEL